MEGEGKNEKRVRNSVKLEKVVMSLVNLTVGEIPRSSMMDKPLEVNITKKMTFMIP